ncbi:MAG: ArsR/SmtB family transcription factor [Acidimicrobiales bacterium]
MPFYDNQQQAELHPPTVVHPSIAVELEWILSSATRQEFRADHPTIDRLYSENPELFHAVREIWGEDERMTCGSFAELLIVARSGGLLFTDDADVLLGRLEDLCSTVSTSARDHPLHAEDEVDRKIILHRLGKLHRSASFRRRYVELMRALWDGVRGDWDAIGHDAVDSAVDAKCDLVAKGAGWRELTRGACDFGGLLDRTISAIGPSGQVAVVPAYFAHVGLLTEVSGCVVLSVKADASGVEARARTQSLARQLRAISDPTRLAILHSLRSGPKTVTELASRFSLAQPTVSNHIKLLRDTGIVADVRDGTRRNLMVRPEVVQDLMESLNHVLLQGRAAVAPSAPGL